MTPRFSLVIPTRNRAGLLRDALATAVAVERDDVEIVVSDNASGDGTRDVALATGDARVRYVRSDTPLSQPDSWEFAVSQATGEYVTLLGDDDGVVPSLFERLDVVIAETDADVVAWQEAWYTHSAFPPPGVAANATNVLTVEPAAGGVREVICADQLPRFFARQEVPPLPALVNSAVSARVLDRIRGRVGRLFPAPDPAVATITAIFALEPSYLAVDQPLGVKGLSGATISIGLFQSAPGMHSSVAEFDRDGLFTLVPLKSRTGTNLVAESLLRMKRALPDELAAYELDLVRYFVTTHAEMADARRRADDTAARAEWERVLAEQSDDVRAAVRRQLARQRAEARTRAVVRQVPALRKLRGAVRRSRHRGAAHDSEFRLVQGGERGFADLPGAARYLDQHVLPSLPDPLSLSSARYGRVSET